MTPQQNTSWMVKVRDLLGQGLGVEDIAIRLGCSAEDIRREIEIYREEGRLTEIVRPKKA
jgi:hypothetical protein